MADASRDSTLPEYSVRVSTRARRVRLTVNAQDGLVVVVPRGLKVDADALVASKSEWARRSLARVAEKRNLHLGGPEALLPGSVEIRSTGRDYAVEYRHTSASVGSVVERAGVLVVSGVDARAQLDALSRWLDRIAHKTLPARLEELSAQHGLPYERCRVTRAKSRWGSCSSRRTISLNRMLVFLPQNLVDALILHELAHTRVMDHSPRFWSYLATLDPAALPHRAQLKGAGAFVPAWVDA